MSPSPPADSAAADPDPKTTFLGIFLGAFFGIDFGTILGPLLEPFWEAFWTHFGVILELRCLSTRRFAIRLCFKSFSDALNLAKSLKNHCFFNVLRVLIETRHELHMVSEWLQNVS